jgi:4-amino-4-deoxy-L-arabinose transferase-like glycosyltransferase
VSLVFRVLCFVPLYGIGKVLVGGRRGFLALLILLLLPYPAHCGSDVTRDWPFLFFLACGVWLLLKADSVDRWWVLGAVGIVCGLGYVIRIESVQLMGYGIVLTGVMFFCTKGRVDRAKIVLGGILLVLGFAASCGWYIAAKKDPMPEKFRKFFQLSQADVQEQRSVAESKPGRPSFAEYVPEDFVRGSVGYGIIRIAERMGENYMYFFAVPFLVGAYLRFGRHHVLRRSEYGVMLFFAVNIAMLVALYRNYGYVSRRHVMPMTVMGVFFVPDGLEAMGRGIEMVFGRRGGKDKCRVDGQRFWFVVLLAIGVGICMPKLLRPLRAEKKAYRVVARWLQVNTKPTDVILTSDVRIAFYADRQGISDVRRDSIPVRATYIVKVYGGRDDSIAPLPRGKLLVEVYSASPGKEDKDRKIVVYRITDKNPPAGG